MLRKTAILLGYFRVVVPASMRPQRNAAENGDPISSCVIYWRASMRPQRNAAENHSRPDLGQSGPQASMRPQRNAAENSPSVIAWRRAEERFNEAAA